MGRAIAVGVALTVSLAVIQPGLFTAVAPLVLVVGLAAVGAWRLWNLHAVLRDTDFGPAMDALIRSDADDQCEQAAFTALQRAAQYLDITGQILGEAAISPDLARQRRILHRQVDSFVFAGDDLGALATAWALEDACKDLTERAAGRWRRPAA